MTTIKYQSEANVRQRTQGVSKELYSVQSINEIIERWSLNAHQILGKSTSTPYTSSDDEYEVIKGFVLNGAAWEIISSFDDSADESRNAKQQMEFYGDILKEKGGSGIVVVKKGYGLNTHLDPSSYSTVDQV